MTANLASGSITVGRITITSVVDIDDQAWSASRLLPDLPRDLPLDGIAAPAETFDHERRNLRLRFGGHVVVAHGQVVLVDCGVGAGKDRPNRAEWHRRTDRTFLDSLARAGYAPSDVDAVVITHAHVDHVGWLTVPDAHGRWTPTFPHARHVFSALELDHWLREFGRDAHANYGSMADSVMPVVQHADVRRLGDGDPIAPGIALRVYPGHTPGNAVVWVQSSGEAAAICGDTIHHPLQLRYPDLSTRFCSDGAASAVGRRRLLDDVVRERALLVPNHFRTEPSPIGAIDDHYVPLRRG